MSSNPNLLSMIDDEDPWADTPRPKQNTDSYPKDPFSNTIKQYDNNNLTRINADRTSNPDSSATLLDTINIFGDSNASSMMDSIIGTADPLTANTNWGDYNSSNILSGADINTTGFNHPESSSTADKLTKLTLSSESSNGVYSSPRAKERKSKQGNGGKGNTNNYIDIDGSSDEDAEEEEEEDEEEEEEVLLTSVDVRIWTDAELKHFNPLSLKNSMDGILLKVREIPEKEGLVFKHINYLVSHTIKFGKEYLAPNDSYKGKHSQNEQSDNEIKIIRRYSDFSWLVEALWKKYPFRLIPELPPKKFALASQNDVLFLQKRRRGLQRFLYQLCKHPILSKENLVIMFLTVPNDFSNWKKFANIELNDEFDGIRVNLPRRFRLDLSDILKGLRDTESEYEAPQTSHHTDNGRASSKNKNEFVINNINQIWNENPSHFKDKEFVSSVTRINENLSKLAEFWSKLYLLVERIEKREIALSADHQRFALFLESMIKVDTELFSMDKLVSSKTENVDESQNLSVINSILEQVCKYFTSSRKLKEEEMAVINNEILESWKNFQDYLISLHFLIERFFNYKIESEKEIQAILQRLMKANEKIKQLKMKSDIRGSEIDKHIDILTTSMDQLSMTISRIILVKTTFVNEFMLFQKVKYLISEVFQDWFSQRSTYSETKNVHIQRLLEELRDMPLGN